MSNSSDYIIWTLLIFTFIIIIGLYVSEFKPLDISERNKIIKMNDAVEHFQSMSSTNDQSKGASQYYKWGVPDNTDKYDFSDKKNVKKNTTPSPKIIPSSTKTTCIEDKNTINNNEICKTCDITKSNDINKYVLKSSVPACPDLSNFVHKNQMNICPDLKNYVLKSEIKACEKVDISKYILKAEIPACPTCPICPTCPVCPEPIKCKTITEFNILEHPDIKYYLKKSDVDQNYTKNDDIKNNYINKSELSKNYMKLDDIQKNYISKTELGKYYLNANDINKYYISKATLNGNYISSDDISKYFISINDLNKFYIKKSDIDEKYVKKFELDNYYTRLQELTNNNNKTTPSSNIQKTTTFSNQTRPSNNIQTTTTTATAFSKQTNPSNSMQPTTTTFSKQTTPSNLSPNYVLTEKENNIFKPTKDIYYPSASSASSLLNDNSAYYAGDSLFAAY